MTLALGADLNPLAAIRSAILELGQTGPHLGRLLRNKTWPVPPDESAVCDMLDHAAVGGGGKWRERVNRGVA